MKYRVDECGELEERSPSPRRAWIEITRSSRFAIFGMSPSPRRAWIEMLHALENKNPAYVALPTEGVD